MSGTAATRLVYFGAQHKPRWFVEQCPALPDVKDGEVLVRVRLTTLSAEDLKNFTEMSSDVVPAVIGSEAVCEVVQDLRSDQHDEEIEQLHSNVCVDRTVSGAQVPHCGKETPLSAGTRCIFSHAVPCDDCQECRNGHSRWCDRKTEYGRTPLSTGKGFSGTYATHMVLRKGSTVIPIPCCISDRLASIANGTVAPMVCAVEQARNSSSSVAIVTGSSLSAVFACLLLRHNGCKRVICCDANQSRLKLLAKYGFETMAPINAENMMCCQSSTGADCVIDTAGSQSLAETGMRALRCGGRYVCCKPNDNIHLQINSVEVVRKCLSIKGASGYEPRHLKEALRFLEEYRDQYPFDELFSRRTYNLHEYEAAVHVAELSAFHRVCITP